MNPRISTTSVEASQVVGSFSLLEDFPVYNQVQSGTDRYSSTGASCRSRNSRGSGCGGYRNELLSPPKCFHRSVCNCTPQYNCARAQSPQIQEQSAVTVNSQFPVTAVEASQVVDSFSLSEEFAAPAEVYELHVDQQLRSCVQPNPSRERCRPCDTRSRN